MDFYPPSYYTRYSIISYTLQTSSEDVVPCTLEPMGCVPVTLTIYSINNQEITHPEASLTYTNLTVDLLTSIIRFSDLDIIFFPFLLIVKGTLS